MAEGGTTVVVQQSMVTGGQSGIQQNIAEWSTGLCGCFEDCGSCLMGYFCMSCMLCDVSRRLGECPLLPHCIPGSLVPLRTKLRTLYGLRGSILCDFCILSYCGPLAICQMDRELKNRGTYL